MGGRETGHRIAAVAGEGVGQGAVSILGLTAEGEYAVSTFHDITVKRADSRARDRVIGRVDAAGRANAAVGENEGVAAVQGVDGSVLSTDAAEGAGD